MVTDYNITQKLKDGWMSGIIDGEGCFYAKLGSKTKTSVYCRFTLRVCSVTMIQAFSTELTNKKIKHTIREITKTQKEHHRPSFMLDINTKASLLKFLRIYSGNLINKKAEATMVMDFLEKAVLVKQYKCTDEDLEIVNKLKHLKTIA